MKSGETGLEEKNRWINNEEVEKITMNNHSHIVSQISLSIMSDLIHSDFLLEAERTEAQEA